jgi:predicted nucleic acid-binding protein
MASKVMLDANVILDYTLKRVHFETAKEILKLALDGSINAFVTPSVVHICGYWLTKAYGPEKAKKLMLTILADITSIDINHQTTIAALHSSIRDIEDALQYYTALHHKLDYFISRDKQLGKEALALLPVYTPEQFLKEWI